MDYKKLYESCVENLQQKQQKILELNTEVSELKKELKKQENTLEKIRKLLLWPESHREGYQHGKGGRQPEHTEREHSFFSGDLFQVIPAGRSGIYGTP